MRRQQRDNQLSRITVITVTHIPFLAGYYGQSLDVLRLMLASLQAHTEADFDLYVFDNASCPEVRDFLLAQHRQGAIQSLTLSGHNVGIVWNLLFGAAPGEIIVYADSDMYFEPGWLPGTLEILEAYPDVGVVTALPTRHAAAEFAEATLAWARSDPEVNTQSGDLLEPEWISGYCEGFGLDEVEYRQWWCERLDYRLTYRGVPAFVGALSNQFAGHKSTLAAAAPPRPNEWIMHQSGALFERLAALGYLSLSTARPYVRHLGNTVPRKWRAVAEQLGLRLEAAPLPERHNLLSRLALTDLGRRAGLRLYDALFRVLYRGNRRGGRMVQ